MNTPATSGTALASLPEPAQRLASASLSTNTRRAYRGALARLDAWLDNAGDGLTDATLAAYLAKLHDAGRSPTVLGQVIAVVRFTAQLTGTPDPAGPATARVIAGARREGRTRGRGQAAGVQWAQADAAAAQAAHADGSLSGLRDAAILAVMSDAMLRRSECAALDVDDVQTESDGSGRLTIRHSKTDPNGEGAIQFIGVPTVTRVRTWLHAAGITHGALFRRIRRGGHCTPERLAAQSIAAIVARRAADTSIEGRVSGHSLRVGAAQSLAAAGASLVEMQTAGRWTSPTMPGRYTRGQRAARGAVAKLRYGATTVLRPRDWRHGSVHVRYLTWRTEPRPTTTAHPCVT